MSSSSAQRKKRRLAKIFADPFVPSKPCDHCCRNQRPCVYIADFSIMSCANCTRLGKPCVTSSLEKLDRVVEELTEKIESDEQEIERLKISAEDIFRKIEALRQRIRRNREVRNMNNSRVDEEVAHLAANTEFDPNDPELSDFPGLESDLLGAGLASPFSWPDGHPSSSNQEAAV